MYLKLDNGTIDDQSYLMAVNQAIQIRLEMIQIWPLTGWDVPHKGVARSIFAIAQAMVFWAIEQAAGKRQRKYEQLAALLSRIHHHTHVA